ncbi:hypothetical protein A3E97_01630 [Candidatus Uhrbacteria bacterium RIFCSPHIGHO2_12_FULL_47_12]|nr:MAG: hypothetical protein A2839_00920 [Candidatus Uhrbacteria bacterium RIFCSPHIGHO2_01_FULL_47_10]OGL77078.1 MAG: hypothetical protein A3E97_01630 [Candidatus Uhrbacteria bacterium RIFCSPHIGHO2_12_FULL_47_12]
MSCCIFKTLPTKLRDEEGKAILTIPPVVRIVIVRVEPATVIITIRREKVRIAAKNVRSVFHAITL